MTILYRTLFTCWIKYFIFSLFSCCLLYILIDASIHLFSLHQPIHYFYILLNYQEVLISFSFLLASTKSILDINKIQFPLILQLSHIHLRSIIRPIAHSGTIVLCCLFLLNESFFTKAYNYKHSITAPPKVSIEQFQLSNNQRLICAKKGKNLAEGYLLINDNEIWHIEKFSLKKNIPHLNNVSKLTKNNSEGFSLVSSEEEVTLSDVRLKTLISKSDHYSYSSLSIMTLLTTTQDLPIIITKLISFLFPLYLSLTFTLYLLYSKSRHQDNFSYLISLGYFISQSLLFKITCIFY